MNNQIKVAVLPMSIIWCDYDGNMAFVEENLQKLEQDTDIVVLPELFSTGFIQDQPLIEQMASLHGKQSLERIRQWCIRYRVAIAGSVLIKENGQYYNRGFFIEPSGEGTFYDKRHLFCLSPESEIFAPGKGMPPVIRYRGWNISLVICYDLRFPVWCRNVNNRYDMLIVPANWPSARGYAWRQLLIARAIENQAVIVGADRSGCDDYGDYEYMSYVFDPSGHEIAPCDKSDGKCPNRKSSDIFYATYTIDAVNRMRMRLPVGADADSFKFIERMTTSKSC